MPSVFWFVVVIARLVGVGDCQVVLLCLSSRVLLVGCSVGCCVVGDLLKCLWYGCLVVLHMVAGCGMVSISRFGFCGFLG